ncbi:DUF4845 domain-containing protein [Pleionea sp. CnH1-48]|uniref:DUF4845 domain-containing protein n=1 Tax=Pleionea sp. CnH1-48 TaxID=2954494 RepID=UPI002097F19E|nr:DUF4845 domain-containing protein [Pleionea sp. CnH1-48]MCO7225467.1 DUF4845 domain-containing protein [Pleionea sp. CnH1-48]
MFRRQKGASIWSIMMIGAMVGGYGMVGIQLVPVYIENMSVKKALESLEKENTKMSKAQVNRKLAAQFNINQVERVTKENIHFKPTRGGKMRVSIVYDVKIDLVSNLSVLVEFDDSVEI